MHLSVFSPKGRTGGWNTRGIRLQTNPSPLELDRVPKPYGGKLDISSGISILNYIIPTQCFYRFFGDFDWSVGKIKLFLHFDKSPCVGIFDNCLDITVVDCVNNNELYIKL